MPFQMLIRHYAMPPRFHAFAPYYATLLLPRHTLSLFCHADTMMFSPLRLAADAISLMLAIFRRFSPPATFTMRLRYDAAERLLDYAAAILRRLFMPPPPLLDSRHRRHVDIADAAMLMPRQHACHTR